MRHPTKRKHVIIYQKRLHLVATLAVLAAPFLFLLVFSRLGHIATGTLFFDVFVSCLRLLIAYSIAAITSFGILGLLILIFSVNKLIWLPLLAWSHELTEE